MSPQDELNEASARLLVSEIATEYVKHLGETLLGWKGVQVVVVVNPDHKNYITMTGGPIVTATVGVDPNKREKYKQTLYDVAKLAMRNWNPVEIPRSHKIVRHRGDKPESKKGEPEFLIPLKFCTVTTFRSITIKGPEDTSVTVEDRTGHRTESEMINEARLKLSMLFEWDNKEEE